MRQIASLFLLSAMQTVLAKPHHPLEVVVSVAPQRYFVQKIGGDEVNVEVLLLPGHNPTTFSPTPAKLASLSRAVLYYRIGMPFELAGMPRIQGINSTMEILDARSGIALMPMATNHDHSPSHTREAHDAQATDPHIWLNPRLVSIMAEQLADTLIRLRPESRAHFRQNLKQFLAELAQLDEEIQKLLTPLQNRQMMVFHPSWGYFADAYGLVQRSIEIAGKSPGVKMLTETISHGKKDKIRRIFVQPQFDHRRAETVAVAIGAKLTTINPLAENYSENLLHVARTLADQ